MVSSVAESGLAWSNGSQFLGSKSLICQELTLMKIKKKGVGLVFAQAVETRQLVNPFFFFFLCWCKMLPLFQAKFSYSLKLKCHIILLNPASKQVHFVVQLLQTVAVDMLVAGTVTLRRMGKGLFFFLQCVATFVYPRQTSNKWLLTRLEAGWKVGLRDFGQGLQAQHMRQTQGKEEGWKHRSHQD